ncbi:aminodeoxychorismate synthase component I [Pseudomonas azerbaijanoccidens]|uniref:aminodeoxychorismate synthase component I n=1 Tax=Pseudomonas azerbaijanoccidentalis TaxID=2842347 RepID=UPI002009E7BA|nr:aminodeoxychorismate synthase component I [Pseudomonas azerbaijanoccidentalis]MCK8663737.1 aminodeoxychorismate synthase component I [Pseudomonas azerbaijanoccidentalis]
MISSSVLFRVLPACSDALTVFQQFFGESANKFLLESAVVIPGFSRFSFMGDDQGPQAESITYDAIEHRARVVCGDSVQHFEITSLFDFLQTRLQKRVVECSAELPFDFNLGYVGVFGYELKSETIGVDAWRSASHDAALIFATRLIVIDHLEGKTWLLHLASSEDESALANTWFDDVEATLKGLASVATASQPTPGKRFSIDDVQRWISSHAHMRHDKPAYLRKIDESLAEIAHGESYEICLTNLIEFPFEQPPIELYRQLQVQSPAPHSAYFNVGDLHVVSASPERFLSVDRHGQAEAKPIKGTRPRGTDAAEDGRQIDDLLGSEKDRAENLMIVDLLRNDLGQVCALGSVQVPKLFDVETYSHVHQLVSTVRGTLKPGVSSVQCVKAAFPGGSMTGAPKKRTMEIIDRLEQGPRGIYSGALGWFGLSGACDLSIVIRSVLIDRGQARLGVGGAITALSDPEEEFNETLIKARNVVEAVERMRVRLTL